MAQPNESAGWIDLSDKENKHGSNKHTNLYKNTTCTLADSIRTSVATEANLSLKFDDLLRMEKYCIQRYIIHNLSVFYSKI